MADRIKNYQQEADQITTLKAIRTDLGVTPSSYTPDATVVTKDRIVTYAQAEEELVVLGDIEKGVKQQIVDADIAQKDISNIKALLQGNLYDYQTDSTSAYTKTVPSGAMPYAGLEQIGGKTIVWNQLFPDKEAGTQTTNGVTRTFNADGSVSLVGTATASFNTDVGFDLPASTSGHKIYLTAPSGCTSSTYHWYHNGTSGRRQATGIYTNTWTGAWRFRIIDGAEINVTFYPQWIDLTAMFGSGNEPSTVEEFQQMFPAEWYPYNEGTLLSAGVTEVVSQTTNLVNPADIEQGSIDGSGANANSDNVCRTAYIDVKPNTTYELWCSGYVMRVVAEYTSSNTQNKQTTILDSNPFVFTTQATTVKMRFNFSKTNPVTPTSPADVGDKASCRSLPPYTYSIPAEIQALEGYGWSAGTASNYIDFERKKFVKCVDRVDIGNMSGWWGSSNPSIGIYRLVGTTLTNQIGIYSQTDNTKMGNVVCEKYATYPTSGMPDHSIAYGVSNGNAELKVSDSSNTNFTAWVNSLKGVYLYYELATPVETDISEYITDDNLINVDSGGTLTFPNSNGTDYQIPVPSEETYMIDLQEAINNG